MIAWNVWYSAMIFCIFDPMLRNIMNDWAIAMNNKAAANLMVKSYEVLLIRTTHDSSILNKIKRITLTGIDAKKLLVDLFSWFFCGGSRSIRSIADIKCWLLSKTLNLLIANAPFGFQSICVFLASYIGDVSFEYFFGFEWIWWRWPLLYLFGMTQVLLKSNKFQ